MVIDKEQAKEQLIDNVRDNIEDVITDFRNENNLTHKIFNLQSAQVFDKVTDNEAFYDKATSELDNDSDVDEWLRQNEAKIPDEVEAVWDFDESAEIAKQYTTDLLRSAYKDTSMSVVEKNVNQFSAHELLEYIQQGDNVLEEKFAISMQKANFAETVAQLKSDFRLYWFSHSILSAQKAIRTVRERNQLQNLIFTPYANKIADYVTTGSLKDELIFSLDSRLTASTVDDLNRQYEQFISEFDSRVEDKVLDLWDSQETDQIIITYLTTKIENSDWSKSEQKQAVGALQQNYSRDLLNYLNTTSASTVDTIKDELVNDEDEVALTEIQLNKIVRDGVTAQLDKFYPVWLQEQQLVEPTFYQPQTFMTVSDTTVSSSVRDLKNSYDVISYDKVQDYIKEFVDKSYLDIQFKRFYNFDSAKEKAISLMVDNLDEIDQQHDVDFWQEKLNSMSAEDVLYYRKNLESLVARFED